VHVVLDKSQFEFTIKDIQSSISVKMKFLLSSIISLAAVAQSANAPIPTQFSVVSKPANPAAAKVCTDNPLPDLIVAALDVAVETKWDDVSVGPIEVCLNLYSTENNLELLKCTGAAFDFKLSLQNAAGGSMASVTKAGIKLDEIKILVDGKDTRYVICQAVNPCDFTFEAASSTFTGSKITVSGVVKNVAGGIDLTAQLSAKSSNFILNGNALEEITVPMDEAKRPFFNPYSVIRQNATCDDDKKKCTTKFTYDSKDIDTVTTQNIKFTVTGNKIVADCAAAAEGYRIDTAAAPGPCDPLAKKDGKFECSKMTIKLLDGVSNSGSAVHSFALLSLIGAFFV
jgi:hypothetical protein